MDSAHTTWTATGDFLADYRAISSKLKKRFLRRPNVAEATEQFGSLAKRLHNDDEPEYEGVCHLAVARCEQSAGQPLGEADALLAAARSFLAAEDKRTRAHSHSIQEHLAAAVNNYSHAIRVFEECGQPSRAGAICLEVAEVLYRMNHKDQAVTFFEKAADLRNTSALDYIHALERIAECRIELGDYHSSLATLTEVAQVAEANGGRPVSSVYADTLARCEILRVLLLLLIEPTSQGNISPSLIIVLEKYSRSSEDAVAAEEAIRFLTEETFIELQSVVMAVEVRDYDALLQLEEEMEPKLDALQKMLLRKLVSYMRDKGKA